MVDIVLVHGTTQSAAGFAGLVEAIHRGGVHRAHCVNVPGGAAGTAADYAEILAGQLPAGLDRPVVLAHSAAGLLLPALARRLDARHQLWFAAAVADHAGQRSFLDEVRGDPDAVMRPEWRGVDPTTDPVLATYFLFHDATLDALRAALPTVASCDLSAIYNEIPREDPARVPSTYLLPTEDRTLRRDWMHRVARERLGVEPVFLAGGHNAYSAHPEAVAAAIATALAD